MRNLALIESKQAHRGTSLQRLLVFPRAHSTVANGVGLAGAIVSVVCLIALPQPWNMRVPLYLAVTMLTLLRPLAALYLLPFTVPWGSLDSINVGGFSLTSSDILVGLLVACWLMSFVLHRYAGLERSVAGPLNYDVRSLPRYLIFALLLFLLAMLLSTTGTFSLKTSLKEIVKWLEVFIVLVLGASYLHTRRQIWTLVAILFLAAISQACYGYVQYYFNIGPQAFVRAASLRVYGTFDQPNPYAGYINMTLTVALSLTLLGRNWATRVLSGITVLSLGVVEYFTQSRGGEIAIVVAVLLIVTLGMPRLRVIVSVGAIMALMIIAGYLGGTVPQRLLMPVLKVLGLSSFSFVSPSPQDYSTAERLAHWIVGLRMFLDHPLTGIGIGNYPNAYPQYYITIFVNSLGHAHNYYINIAAETGLLGLIAFLLFLIAVFVAGGRAFLLLSRRLKQVKARRTKPEGGMTEVERRAHQRVLGALTNDRALAVGIVAALASVCVHNIVDDLFVHSMALLFALLLVMLIRLEGVTQYTIDHRRQ